MIKDNPKILGWFRCWCYHFTNVHLHLMSWWTCRWRPTPPLPKEGNTYFKGWKRVAALIRWTTLWKFCVPCVSQKSGGVHGCTSQSCLRYDKQHFIMFCVPCASHKSSGDFIGGQLWQCYVIGKVQPWGSLPGSEPGAIFCVPCTSHNSSGGFMFDSKWCTSLGWNFSWKKSFGTSKKLF